MSTKEKKGPPNEQLEVLEAPAATPENGASPPESATTAASGALRRKSGFRSFPGLSSRAEADRGWGGYVGRSVGLRDLLPLLIILALSLAAGGFGFFVILSR